MLTEQEKDNLRAVIGAMFIAHCDPAIRSRLQFWRWLYRNGKVTP